jgi:hypothetical protein
MAISWEGYGPCIAAERFVPVPGVFVNGEQFGTVERDLYVVVEIFDTDTGDVLGTDREPVAEWDNEKAVMRYLVSRLAADLGVTLG